MARQITCINKAGGQHENPYVAISNLGWTDDITNAIGNSTREEMYDFIVNKKGQAYVKDDKGNMAYLAGETTVRGTKYVKTKADNVTSDNLLKLPECK
jgi:hypothetical protein